MRIRMLIPVLAALAPAIACNASPGVDSDADGLWDVDERAVWGTDPASADTDGDGLNDRADPTPTRDDTQSGGIIPTREYAVFRTAAEGAAPEQLTATAFMEHHLVFIPGREEMLYQRYLRDVNGDGEYTEADLSASAIGIMRADGSRPRLLTDTADGIRDNGAIDVTPEPSPDGRFFVFASDRGDPGSFAPALHVYDLNTGDVVGLGYGSGCSAPVDGLDADPDWGAGDRITFKREAPLAAPTRFSQIWVATLDRDGWQLEDCALRTDGTGAALSGFPAGDFDPKFSADGGKLASYRHIDDSIVLFQGTPQEIVFGDWDLWAGETSDPSQPGDASVTFLDVDGRRADLLPRWSPDGSRLAFWSLDADAADAGQDALDVFVIDGDGGNRTNLSADQGWLEEMPTWHPSGETVYYSASR